MNFIDLSLQQNLIGKNVRKRFDDILNRGSFIMGREVSELEETLSQYVGVKHCISCANGTDALQLSLMSLNINRGDKVITTPFTFFATAEAIAIVGAEPIFVDIDETTYNLCPKKLEIYLSKLSVEDRNQVKAVIAVDLFGLPAHYNEIQDICKKFELKLIEDGAQGFGGAIKDRKVCSFGDIATTSFFPAKPLGCYGDGGAVFTNSDELAEKVKSFRVHGKGVDKYDNVRIGLNSRLDTLQAAVLLEKIEIFNEELSKRQVAAERYISKISNAFIKPFLPKEYKCAWAQFCLRVESYSERDEVIKKLSRKKIPCQIYYKTPLHLQSAFSNLGYSKGDFEISEKVSNSIFSIPMHPYLTNTQIDLIAEALNECKT